MFHHSLLIFTLWRLHLQKFRDICSPSCDHGSLRRRHIILLPETKPLISVGGYSTATTTHLGFVTEDNMIKC